MLYVINNDKITKLHGLLNDVEKCLKCYKEFNEYSEEDRIRIRGWCNRGPWFFPPHEETGVKGFFGIGDTCFVCQRPSTKGGRIPDKFLTHFYELLEKNGFKDAHITDLIKCKGPAKDFPKYMIENCFPFLLKEIEILKPKLIVAVSEIVYNVLESKMGDIKRYTWENVKLEYISHYAYRFKKDVDEKLKKEFEKLKEMRRNL